MWFSDLIKYVFGEPAVIWQAPFVFFSAGLVLSVLAYAAARWRYSTIIGHRDAAITALEARVQLRDDQLSDKFQNTPPDEARQMIEALQVRVARVQSRRVIPTAEGRAALIDRIRPPDEERWTARIRWDALAPDAENLACDLAELLEEAGWTLDGARIISGHRSEGVTLKVLDRNALSDPEGMLRELLDDAKLKFKVEDDEDDDGVWEGKPEIYIGAGGVAGARGLSF